MKRITVTVEDEKVAAVIAAMDGKFTDLHVNDADAAPLGNGHVRTRTIRGERRSRTQDAIMRFASSHSDGFRLQDAIGVMVDGGFSPNSASPALSQLIHAGKLTAGSDGVYRGVA